MEQKQIQKPVTVWACATCGREFENKDMCQRCEDSHKVINMDGQKTRIIKYDSFTEAHGRINATDTWEFLVDGIILKMNREIDDDKYLVEYENGEREWVASKRIPSEEYMRKYAENEIAKQREDEESKIRLEKWNKEREALMAAGNWPLIDCSVTGRF